jgi:PAS domain S-box-containing protein
MYKMETTKKELYKQILEKRQRIREFAGDFIFIVDNNFSIQYLNNCAARHLGCPQQEVVGKPLSGFFPPNSYEILKQNLKTVFQSGEPLSAENNVTFSNKELWFDSRFTPITEHDKVTSVLVIARNISGHGR